MQALHDLAQRRSPADCEHVDLVEHALEEARRQLAHAPQRFACVALVSAEDERVAKPVPLLQLAPQPAVDRQRLVDADLDDPAPARLREQPRDIRARLTELRGDVRLPQAGVVVQARHLGESLVARLRIVLRHDPQAG